MPALPASPVADDGAETGSPQELRRLAEARWLRRAASTPEEIESLSTEEARQMLHELQVHQIELELQNEELRNAQVALDFERERYFDLYDLAPIGYCTISEQGLIKQANLAAASLLGTTRSELLKQRWSRFIHRDDADAYYLRRKKLVESGEPQSCDLRMVKKDGSEFWGHWAAAVSHDSNGHPELRAMLSDISERKRLDQVLQENNVALERARTAADAANRAKSEFLSSMSHELRTPLNAILGFGQLIESGSPPPTPAQKRNVDHILKAGWFLLALVDEILDLAAIESGRLSLAMDTVSLEEVLRECLAMVEAQAQAQAIRILLPEFDAPCYIHADRNRVKQVLSNLLSNAIMYNRPEGSVVVDWSRHGAGRMRINVRDTGMGLPPERLAQLFQRFNRLGQEAGKVQGTGIGLVVSKRLIEMMHGAIGVESTVGVGSVFWVELNLASDQASVRAATQDAAASRLPAQSGTPIRTVLYIEDNPANLSLMEEIISRRPDLRLLTAVDGDSGIEIARTVLPDVILMDINLPGISGIEALRILAQAPATAGIPVIALSADALVRDIEFGLGAGFFRYITKPIKLNELMETLDLALESSRSRAGGSGVTSVP
ncbi:MAG: ATP-binding protein [Lysobacterales bacterium]